MMKNLVQNPAMASLRDVGDMSWRCIIAKLDTTGMYK
jgi:hypothetical protein